MTSERLKTAERLKSAVVNAETCVAALRTDRAEGEPGDLPDEVKDALCDLALEMASTVWDADSQPVQFGKRWVLGVVLHWGPPKPTVLVTSVKLRDVTSIDRYMLRCDVLQDGFGPSHSDSCCRDRLARALPVLLRLLEEAVVGATGGMAARTAKTALPRVQALRAEAELLVAARAVLGS